MFEVSNQVTLHSTGGFTVYVGGAETVTAPEGRIVDLRPPAVSLLTRAADWLRANPLKVQVLLAVLAAYAPPPLIEFVKALIA